MKRDTMHRVFRSEIDIIYQMLKISINDIAKTNIYLRMSMNEKPFSRILELCEDKDLIIKEKKLIGNRKLNLYKTTRRGLEYIIIYDKMIADIEKLNIMLK